MSRIGRNGDGESTYLLSYSIDLCRVEDPEMDRVLYFERELDVTLTYVEFKLKNIRTHNFSSLHIRVFANMHAHVVSVHNGRRRR